MRGVVRARGSLRIEHGRHPLARLLAWMCRLPLPGAAVDTRLVVDSSGDTQHWRRTFGSRRLETWQRRSSGAGLAERFGILEFQFRLDDCRGGVVYVQREAALVVGPVRVRIPAALAPRVEAREDPAGPSRVRLDVRVTLPGIGPLIAYGGIIDIEEQRA